MKKLATLLLVLSLMASAAIAATVKIGVILPLSGDNANLGQPQLRAVNLFQNECENGDYKHDYELIIEDDQLTPRVTAQVAHKLVDIDNVDGVVSFFCAAGKQLPPMARQKKIPHINVICSDDVADAKWSFEHWPEVDKEASAFVDMLEKMGSTRVAILCMRQPGVKALAEATVRMLEARGIPCELVYYNPDEREFRTHMTKLAAFEPDVLVPLAFSPGMEIILRRNIELGYNFPTATLECFDFVADLTGAEGAYMVSGGAPTDEFNKRLKEASGEEAVYGVGTLYDGLNLMRAAFEASDEVDHAQAAQWLGQFENFDSALGKISMQENGRIDSPIGFYQVRDGKIEPITLEEIK